MNDLGADVVVIEANDRVLPRDTQVASTKEELTNRGVTFYENIQLTKDHFNQTDKGVTNDIGLNTDWHTSVHKEACCTRRSQKKLNICLIVLLYLS